MNNCEQIMKQTSVGNKNVLKLSWAAFYAPVDNDPWGVPYRIVSGRLGR